MRALVIIAHGSKLESSNLEVRQRMEQLQSQLSDDYDLIETAFLELAQPSIEQAVNACLEHGADHLTVLPYFLAAGKHVNEDIPKQTRSACEQQRVVLNFLPHIGSSDQMLDLMCGLARHH